MKHPLFAGLLSIATFAAFGIHIAAAAPAAGNGEDALAAFLPGATTDSADSVATPALDVPAKIAFLLPQKESRFESVAQEALRGVLAANYAQPKPAEVLLIRPDESDSIKRQLDAAAAAGALVAIGPIERRLIEEMATLEYVPLPVVTLNQIELDYAVPLTPEEIEEKNRKEEADRLADAALRELNTIDDPSVGGELAVREREAAESSGDERIEAKTKVKGLILAEDNKAVPVRYEPKIFPRGMLMLGLSMEDDARYMARLGVEALPRLTESGKRPKVLVITHDTPVEQRIAGAFTRELTEKGFAPDQLTVDIQEFGRITKIFDLVVSATKQSEFDEVPIDQEVDPLGWRQQQLRLQRLEAAKRARASLAEPPYQAVFLATDGAVASLVRSRLPLRSRVWGTPAVYPGNPETSSEARTRSFDLSQTGFVEAPFVLGFDAQKFEEQYKVPSPVTTIDKRLFALGADALTLASQIASGSTAESVNGLLGILSYDLDASPQVLRTGQTAMILSGEVELMSTDELIRFDPMQYVSKSKRFVRQSNSLDRIERETERQARAAGTAIPSENILENQTETAPSITETPAAPIVEPAPAFVPVTPPAMTPANAPSVKPAP